MNGIIIKGIGGFYYVKADDGHIYECKARGRFRKDGVTPIIGDNAEIEVRGGKGSVTRILPRKNALVRPAVANIDALVIVAAAASPEPNPALMDKLTVTAAANDIEPVICINKIDLADGEGLAAIYEAAGFKTFMTDAEHGKGTDALKDFLRGAVTAFAGLSGVGKSTLLNSITGGDLKTGDISERLRRGRHTTRHVELFELDGGGFVLDTPGFSSFEMNSIRADELWEYFPEMADTAGKCRFRGCSHINEPDCAVKDKLGRGEIAPSRYESYVEIYNILKEIKDWERNDTVTINFSG